MLLLRYVLFMQFMVGLSVVAAEARSLSAAWWPRAIYNEIVARAAENPELRIDALLLLQAAAEGRAERITDVMLRPFGIGMQYISVDAMNSLDVRALAYLAIGRLSEPAAFSYLKSIRTEQFSDDERVALSEPIRSAIQMQRLSQLSDAQRKAEFLVDLVREKRRDVYAKVPVTWAEDELCRLGALVFLGEVETSIRGVAPSRREEFRSVLCREKMLLVASNTDRTAAFAGAIRDRITQENDALLAWVINELVETRTEDSWEALERFTIEARQTHGQAIYRLPIYRHVHYVELCMKTRFH